jgi:hypothetical protein
MLVHNKGSSVWLIPLDQNGVNCQLGQLNSLLTSVGSRTSLRFNNNLVRGCESRSSLMDGLAIKAAISRPSIFRPTSVFFIC